MSTDQFIEYYGICTRNPEHLVWSLVTYHIYKDFLEASTNLTTLKMNCSSNYEYKIFKINITSIYFEETLPDKRIITL